MQKNDLIFLFNQGTDNYFILNYLLTREWVNVLELMTAHGYNEKNFAARSRISDINKKIKPKGFEIISRISKVNHQGEYMLREIKNMQKEMAEQITEISEIKEFTKEEPETVQMELL